MVNVNVKSAKWLIILTTSMIKTTSSTSIHIMFFLRKAQESHQNLWVPTLGDSKLWFETLYWSNSPSATRR